MEQGNMTAQMSAFVRGHHFEHHAVRVFDDPVAASLFSKEKFSRIGESIAGGIRFFDPGFSGNREEALERAIDGWLAPAPLGRAAFAERALETAVRVGARQYLILAAGYDTFAYRQPGWARKLTVFEIDLPAVLQDKRRRLERAGILLPENLHFVEADFRDMGWPAALENTGAFSREKISFCSLLGLIHYLPEGAFAELLEALGSRLRPGSSLAFDYPNKDAAEPPAQKRSLLAEGAGEPMRAKYSYQEMERLLSDRGFRIYEHLGPQEMTEQYFRLYNLASPDRPMTASGADNVCLAVRK